MESDRYLVSIIDDGSYRWCDKGDSARCIRRISNCSQVLLSEYSATERMWPQVRDSAFIHVSYGVNKPTIPLEPWFIQHAPWQNYDVSAQYIWAYRKGNCRDQQDQDNIRPITYPLPSWRVISDPQECSMTRQPIRHIPILQRSTSKSDQDVSEMHAPIDLNLAQWSKIKLIEPIVP